MKYFTFLLSTIFYCNNISFAQNRYIGVLGNDSITNNCSDSTNPCATINHAVLQANVHDSIYIFSGNYFFQNTQIISKAVILIALDTTNKPNINSNASDMFQVSSDSVNIIGIRLLMGLTSTTGLKGITSDSLHNHLVIRNNEFISVKPYSSGLVFGSYAIHLKSSLVQQVSIINNAVMPLNALYDAHGRGIAFGLSLTNGPGGEIRGNSMFAFYPIQSIQNSSNLLISNNYFVGNTAISYCGSGTNNLVEYNTFDGYSNAAATNLLSLLEIKGNDSGFIIVQNNAFNNYKNIGLFSCASRNVTVKQNTFTPMANASAYKSIYANSKLQTSGTQSATYANKINIIGNHFYGAIPDSGTAIEYANHFGNSPFSFEDTIYVGGSDSVDKNTFDPNIRYYIALDTMSGSSNDFAFWNGYSITNMLPFSQNVWALVENNNYNLTDTSLIENKMFDSLDFNGLGTVIIYPPIITRLSELENTSLEAFPNPAQDYLQVNFPIGKSNNSVQVISSSGTCVIHQQISNTLNKIDVSNLPKGVYLLKFSTDEQVLKRKFIKQ